MHLNFSPFFCSQASPPSPPFELCCPHNLARIPLQVTFRLSHLCIKTWVLSVLSSGPCFALRFWIQDDHGLTFLHLSGHRRISTLVF